MVEGVEAIVIGEAYSSPESWRLTWIAWARSRSAIHTAPAIVPLAGAIALLLLVENLPGAGVFLVISTVLTGMVLSPIL